MELHVITRQEHPQLFFIRSLYESTFPVEERRDWHQLLQLLQEPAMQLSVNFYERLGYTMVDIDYHQPPYRKGEAVLPMLLMSHPAITDEMEAKAIAGSIRASVYERYY